MRLQPTELVHELAANEMAADTLTLLAGDHVVDHRIIELLAHGGMGDVCRATGVRLDRDVALKMMTHDRR
jgi:hypothetical protein